MKKLLFLLALLLSFEASQATNYYIAANGNDASAGTSTGTAWRTIAKLNTSWSLINPGDSILFRRGDTWNEAIVFGKSGTSLNKIVVGAYGSGFQPVITGYITLTAFSNPTPGVYVKNFPSGKQNFINLEFDGVMQRFARTPNAHITPYYYESGIAPNNTTSIIIDNQRPSVPGKDSGEVVVRKAHWIWERGKVTSVRGDSITYGLTGNNVNGSAGVFFGFLSGNDWGYFHQNIPSALDENGEFYFQKYTKNLSIFSSDAISNHLVRASSIDRLIDLKGYSHITIENLYLEGSNISAIYSVNGSYVIVKNCTIKKSGAIGIQFSNVQNTLIQNNIIDWCLSTGIQANANYTDVIGNTVSNIFRYEGMGDYGSDGSCLRGIVVRGDYTNVKKNKVLYAGYSGINVQGNHFVTSDNYVYDPCLVQSDNSAIYTYVGNENVYGPPTTNYVNRIIRGNVVESDDVESSEYGGRIGDNTTYISGIYTDGKSRNILIDSNTIIGFLRGGVTSNNPTGFEIRGNTFYNDSMALRRLTRRNYDKQFLESYKTRGNIFIPKQEGQVNFYYYSDSLYYGSVGDELGKLMDLDSNYTIANAILYRADFPPAYRTAPQSLEGFRALTGEETNTTYIKTFPEYNISSVGTNKYSNPLFSSNINGVTTYSATGSWDNTGKISGGSYKVVFSTATPESFNSTFSSVGSVSGKYRIRFKTLGTTNNGLFRIFFANASSPTVPITAFKWGKYGTSVKQHEFVVEVPTSTSANFAIAFDRSSGTTYLDDVEVSQVVATQNNLSDSLKFVYSTGDTVFVTLGDRYKDVYGKVYNNYDTVLPFRSKLYVYDSPINTISASISSTPILCNGGTTSLISTVIGGTAPYTYRWNTSPEQTTQNTTAVPAGSYRLIVIDADSTIDTAYVTITQPATLGVTGVTGTITVNGGTTTATLAATGGTAPYTYKVGSGSYQASSGFTGLTAGTYTFTVKDANNCTATVSKTITQPSVFSASASVTSPILCNGENATVTVSATGGTTPYTGTGTFTTAAGSTGYLVTDANGNTSTASITVTQPSAIVSSVNVGMITVNGGTTSATVSATGGTTPYTYNKNGGSYQSSGTFTSLTAGTYTFNVKDANNCIVSKSMTITQPTPLGGTAVVTTPIACNGGTATITVTGTGGTTPYSGVGTFTASAGSQSYTITDANGNTYSASVIVTQPSALAATVTSTRILINGGTSTISVSASGGTPPYTYSRNGAAFQSGNSFTGNLAGSYNITIKDANGCTLLKSVAITQPTPVTITVSSTSIACAGDSSTVSVSATGGITPYTGTGTFKVVAGSYTYTVTDSALSSKSSTVVITQSDSLKATVSGSNIIVNGGTTTLSTTVTGGTGLYQYKLNSGSYQSGGTFTGVTAGTHTITVKDANNCTTTKSITITEPDAMSASASSGSISCNGGMTTVSVSATGGTAPYTGTGNYTVGAGTYNYIVTDRFGNTASTSITVTQPTALTAGASAGTITSNGGTTTVTASASGGTSPYTYSLNGGSFQSSTSFTGVIAGSYSIVVRDANNCTAVSSTLVITQPNLLAATATKTAILCNGDSSTVVVSATGGTAPYTGTGTFKAVAGLRSYKVKDANGDSVTVSITITQPVVLGGTASIGTIAEFGGTASIIGNPTGGTAPYTFSLNNGAYQSSSTFNNLVAGDYTITVKDANGCTYIISATLSQPDVVNGARYYVDPSASSSTDQGTISNPWKSLARVNENMGSFRPGDSILFKRGVAFNGYLYITCSGEASRPITFAPYGNLGKPIPRFQYNTGDTRVSAPSRSLITVESQEFVIIDSFMLTDTTMLSTNRYTIAKTGKGATINNSSNIILKNCTITKVGFGVWLKGNNNTVSGCSISNLRMLVNTSTYIAKGDDAGSDAVVLSGADNTVSGNTIFDVWARSYDTDYSGSAININGPATSRNKIMYNRVYNCNNLVEFSSASGGYSDHTLIAYNISINNGRVVTAYTLGESAISLYNIQVFNNTVIEGSKKYARPSELFYMTRYPSTTTVAKIFNLKNNAFYLASGINLAPTGSKLNNALLVHNYNVIRQVSGSINLTVDPTDKTIGSNSGIFTTNSGDPTTWNLLPASNSPLRGAGINVGISKDFYGNNVPSTPDAGAVQR